MARTYSQALPHHPGRAPQVPATTPQPPEGQEPAASDDAAARRAPRTVPPKPPIFRDWAAI